MSDSSIEDFVEEKAPVNAGRRRNYNTNEFAQENPTYQTPYQIDANDDQEIDDQYEDMYAVIPAYNFEAQDTLLRRRMRTAREQASGIEEILMDLPSRTIGRRGGGHVADALRSSNNTTPHNTYSRRFGSRYLKRQLLTHRDSDVVHANASPDVVHELYTEIADDHGDVSNEGIRELPLSMGLKKQIRLRSNANREKVKSKKVGGFDLWKYNMSIKFQHAKESIKKIPKSGTLWSHHLRQIEGHFGSGVLSYFTFLRGLFLLSIPSFILNFSFITLPQILDFPNRTDPTIQFTGEELLTGANWLTETLMYYGYYTNGTIEKIPNSKYNMPLAYLLATAGYFLLCLIWLVKITATSFRSNYIEGKALYNHFINKVFCAWDYGITSDNAAKLHHKTITTELKEILAEREQSDQFRSIQRKLEIYLLRLVTWSLYFVLTGGSMALIYFVNDLLLDDIQKRLQDIVVLQQISLALIVSAINLIMPIIINALTQFEHYKYPRHALYISVLRNFVLKMGMLAVICAFWTDDNLREKTSTTSDLGVTDPNVVGGTVRCWETELGQEIYRLVVVDFLFSIIFATFCAEFLRKIFSTFCCKSLDRAEFSIVNNVMDLIYGQTLCWIGVYFSPLLALLIIIKYFLMFYIKKISVMQNCQPSRKRWRAAQSQTMFNALLLISFLLSAVFLSVVVFREVPSEACGPYRGMNNSYEVVINEFEYLYSLPSGEWFAYLMGVIFNVWFLYAIVLLLAVAIFIKRSRALGYRGLAKALREQIALEGKDKQLMLQWLQNISNQSGPSGGNKNHRVPILHHHDSANPTPVPSRSGSMRNSPEHQFGRAMIGDVLTYVDPQHVEVSNFGKRMNSASPALRKKKEHKDPLLYKALAKQQQRPQSMFVEGNTASSASIQQARPTSQAYDIELDDLSLTDESTSDAGQGALALALAAKANKGHADKGHTSSFQGKVYTQGSF